MQNTHGVELFSNPTPPSSVAVVTGKTQPVTKSPEFTFCTHLHPHLLQSILNFRCVVVAEPLLFQNCGDSPSGSAVFYMNRHMIVVSWFQEIIKNHA